MLNWSISAVPSKSVRFALLDAQWDACIKIWTQATEVALKLSEREFQGSFEDFGSHFLTTYLHERRLELRDELSDNSRRLSCAKPLSRNVYLLSLRSLSLQRQPSVVYNIDTLLDFVEIFGMKNARTIRTVIDSLLSSSHQTIEKAVSQLTFDDRLEAWCLIIALSSIGASMMRPKIAYALIEAYSQAAAARRPLLRRISFMLATEEEITLKFLDALFGLQTEPTQLSADLLAKTDVLDRLKQVTQGRSEFNGMLSALTEAQSRCQAAIKEPGSRQLHSTMEQTFDEAESEVAEVLSKISQVQDLFPDLGDGFIEACLREYQLDVESTTMHLLDDDLPSSILSMDRKEPNLSHAEVVKEAQQATQLDSFAVRANVYDNDDFDKLQFSKAQVSQGRRLSFNADRLLRQSLSADQKKKVLSLAYDPDDDEWDDTYDQFDGTPAVDFQLTDELNDTHKTDLPSADDLLFSALQNDPVVFERSSRKTSQRQDLRARTKFSDEQIEGWKAMLDREPGRARKMAEKHSFSGSQEVLQSTRWSADGQSNSAPDRGRGRGAARGGRGRGHLGGKTVKEDQTEEQKKEQTRRDRARKESRGSNRGRARGGGMRGQARPQG